MFSSFSQEALEHQTACKCSFLLENYKKEEKTFHSILVIYLLLTESQTFLKKVNSFLENFLLIANHVFSKTPVSTVLCLSYLRPFKGGDL